MAARRYCLLVAVLFLSGCAYPVFKASPFFTGGKEGEFVDASEIDPYWPIYYRRGDVVSFLWPIGQITPDSFALRPFYSSYGQKLDILWPFLHFDLENSSGHLFPLGSWGPERFSLFPVVYADWTPDREMVLTPLYLRTRTSHGIPPLLTMWGSRGETSYFASLPYFSHTSHDEDGAVRKVDVIPPLASWSRSTPEDSSLNVVFSAYGHWKSKQDDAGNVHVFPLFRYDHEGEDHGLSLLYLPFTPGYTPFSEQGLSLIGIESRGERFAHKVLPFYSSIEEPDLQELKVLLLYGRTERPDYFKEYVFPLYERSEIGKAKELSLFFYLYGRESYPGHFHERLLPFYWNTRHGETQDIAILPLYYQQTRGEHSKSTVVPLLLSGWDRHENGSSTHLLLSMLAWGSAGDSSFFRVFPLFSTESTGDLRYQATLPFALSSYERIGDETTLNLPLWIVRYASGPETSNLSVLWSLMEHSETPDSVDSYFFPFYDYEAHQEEESFSILGVLYRSHSEGLLATGEPESSHWSVLWKLMESTTQGNRHQFEAFPGFLYQTGENEIVWSWIGKFLRYERKGDAKKVNLFFIPISWGGDEERG